MADLIQSSLFDPTAPPEHLLHKPARKEPPQVVSGLNSHAKEKTPAASTPSRPGHTLAPFLGYFTKRRKTNNNNNNNNNNNSKFNHEHSTKITEKRKDDPHSKADSGGKKFSFFRSKPASEPSPVSEFSEVTTGTEETTRSQNPHDAKQPESLGPQAKDDMEVLCHGLMAKTESFGQKSLLSHPDSESGVQKDTNQELGDLGENSAQLRSDENVALKHEKFMDTSGMQEQLNNINLKRCKNATMPQSISSRTTLPAHSESLSIPPVIEEIEEGSVEEPPVIEVFLPQREPPIKQSPGIAELVQDLDGNLATPNKVKKRRKLRHILRHLLNMNGSFAKEDKQRLVEDEEEDDEEEEQAMAETAIDEQEGQGDSRCPISKPPPTQCDTETAAPEKKRQPGTKGHCRGWGRRVRRSLGRGCHYLGLSVLTVTNYIIAEATFMGPVYSKGNYDWEYIYNTSEYGVNDYM